MSLNLKSLQKKRQRKEAKRNIKRKALRTVLNRKKGSHRLNEHERMIKAIIENMRRAHIQAQVEGVAVPATDQVASSEVEILNETVPAPEVKGEVSS